MEQYVASTTTFYWLHLGIEECLSTSGIMHAETATAATDSLLLAGPLITHLPLQHSDLSDDARTSVLQMYAKDLDHALRYQPQEREGSQAEDSEAREQVQALSTLLLCEHWPNMSAGLSEFDMEAVKMCQVCFKAWTHV